MSDTTIIILVVIAVLLFFIILLYNSLIVKRNNVNNAFACIDTQLKKRCDLIPNLVAAVKAYMTHEKETLTQIADLRAKAMAPHTSPDDRIRYDGRISGLMRNIMINAEQYPDLKANENFMQLQRTMNEIEEQLSAARRTYNAAVTEFNNAIQCFPTNIFASMLGFTQRALFEITEEERKNPNVSELFK